MRPEKTSFVNEIREKITDSVFVILADYRGLSVQKSDDLRARLHPLDANFQVVKNRMFRQASLDLPESGMEEAMVGPSAMVYGGGDVVQVAKVLKDFVKENNLPIIKMGTLRGVILSAADLEILASLPSREVLQATLVGTIAAPMSQLVGVMNQKLASLVYVLKAVQEKKEAA